MIINNFIHYFDILSDIERPQHPVPFFHFETVSDNREQIFLNDGIIR